MMMRGRGLLLLLLLPIPVLVVVVVAKRSRDSVLAIRVELREPKRRKTMVEPPINELSFGCHSNECQLLTVVGPRCACLHILLAAYQMLIDK